MCISAAQIEHLRRVAPFVLVQRHKRSIGEAIVLLRVMLGGLLPSANLEFTTPDEVVYGSNTFFKFDLTEA